MHFSLIIYRHEIYPSLMNLFSQLHSRSIVFSNKQGMRGNIRFKTRPSVNMEKLHYIQNAGSFTTASSTVFAFTSCSGSPLIAIQTDPSAPETPPPATSVA